MALSADEAQAVADEALGAPEGIPLSEDQEPAYSPAGGDEPEAAQQELWSLELMLDVPLDVTVELGRTTMQLGEALALQMGSIIELNRLPGEPLDMHINDRLVARGEVVVVNETLGLRVTEIVNRDTRKPRRALPLGV